MNLKELRDNYFRAYLFNLRTKAKKRLDIVQILMVLDKLITMGAKLNLEIIPRCIVDNGVITDDVLRAINNYSKNISVVTRNMRMIRINNKYYNNYIVKTEDI